MLNLLDSIPDVQNEQETRKVAIDRVGVKDLRYPFRWYRKDGSVCDSIGCFSLDIWLSEGKKGAHMSRFVHLLERNQKVFNVNEMCRMAGELLGELNSTKGQITVTFPFFLSKTAPRSRIKSFLDYEVNIKILVKNDGLNHKFERILAICVPVTSLCPCSKRISKYGAHNQRSMITISVQLDEKKVIPIEDLILIAEQQGSSELFGLLKREDEKAVTEKAYENAKFVEDIVRDVVLKIKDDERIVSYTVEVENFESIHNHSAYARIDG